MSNLDYIGFDVHKKSISFCAKAQDGRILDEGKIVARRSDLDAWVQSRVVPDRGSEPWRRRYSRAGSMINCGRWPRS